jgi:hypothetical protein
LRRALIPWLSEDGHHSSSLLLGTPCARLF